MVYLRLRPPYPSTRHLQTASMSLLQSIQVMNWGQRREAHSGPLIGNCNEFAAWETWPSLLWLHLVEVEYRRLLTALFICGPNNHATYTWPRDGIIAVEGMVIFWSIHWSRIMTSPGASARTPAAISHGLLAGSPWAPVNATPRGLFTHVPIQSTQSIKGSEWRLQIDFHPLRSKCCYIGLLSRHWSTGYRV